MIGPVEACINERSSGAWVYIPAHSMKWEVEKDRSDRKRMDGERGEVRRHNGERKFLFYSDGFTPVQNIK